MVGIDGGGSKTHLVLCDAHSRVLAESLAGRTNIHTSTGAAITTELRRGVQKLFIEAKIPKSQKINVVVAGLAGIDHPKDSAYAHKLVKQAVTSFVSSKSKIHVVNDAIIGLYAGVRDGQGICIIGGTGSNCFGRNTKGKQAWAGGLGHILADEGSGYDIGLRVLSAAAKAQDGRGPQTMLLKLVLKRYQVKTIRDLVPVVYGTGYGKFEIGQLAFDVQAAAAKGDRVARQIAKDAGAELASMVLAVAKKLFSTSAVIKVVMVGGMLQHDPIVQREMKRLVRMKYKKARFILPKDQPVMGAIHLARSLKK